eukprot:512319_1
MDTPSNQILKKRLLHRGRPELLKQLKRCDSSHLLQISRTATKNDLISRIIESSTHKTKGRKKKKRTQGKPTPTPLQMSDPIYASDEGDVEQTITLLPKRKMKKSPKKLKTIDESHTVAPSKSGTKGKKKKKKLKPKSKRKSKTKTDENIDENMLKYMFVIHDTDRPFLNGKECTIVSPIDEKPDEYRVSLINNSSLHEIPKANLRRLGTKHRRKKAIHISSKSKQKLKSKHSKHTKGSTNEALEGCCDELKDVTNRTNQITECALDSASVSMETDSDVDTDSDECVFAIGVFVNYQMILKLFIDTEIEYLFGTKYNTFKTECFTFLEEIYYEGKECFATHKHIKDSPFTLCYYKCNDKQIVFLSNRTSTDRRRSGIECMDLALMCVCKAYKAMPSDQQIVHEVFRLSDRYGFGEINQKEFNKFLRTLTEKRAVSKASSTALFGRIDRDGMKAITYHQLVEYMIEKKKVLWELLLELARDYQLETDLSLYLYQITLSKIHKLILIMYEMYERLLLNQMNQLFANDIDAWENKMVRYIEFVQTNQVVIDDKLREFRKDEKNNKCKKIKYFEKSSYFIHNNMPEIEYNEE